MANSTLSKHAKVNMTTNHDVRAIGRTNSYFNYLAYSVLGGLMFVLCAVLTSFRRPVISRRTAVGGISSNVYNRQLLLSCGVVAIAMWLLFVAIGAILTGSTIWSASGLLTIVNSLIFTVCSLSLAFMIANITTNREAISGIVNVVALGQAFLCGVFIPLTYMPAGIVSIAHILPAYWFVDANNQVANLTELNWTSLWPIAVNWLVIAGFTLLFVAIAALINRYNQRSD